MFSRAKWHPASMGGTPFVRQVRLPLRLAPEWSQCQRCAEVIRERFNALCHCVWWSRVAVCMGMAASVLLIAEVVGAVVVWSARQWALIEVELLSRFKDDKRKPDQKTVPNKRDQEIEMSGRKRCPGTERSRKDCQDSKIRKIQKCQGQRIPRDDKRNMDQEKVASSGKDAKIKKCQGEKQSQPTKRSVKIQKCQEQAGSRESGSIRQRCREQEMSRTKTSKRSRSRRLWQAGGQVLFLYRLPLVFIGSSLSRNFRLPGLYLNMYNQLLSKEENVSSSCSCRCSCNCSCLSIWVYLQAWKRSYAARQYQKCSNSASLPQFLNLTTSKTKLFCETSSIYIWASQWKTKQVCKTSFKNGKLSAELTALCQCVLRFFPVYLSKVLRLPRKSEPGHTKCCTCHGKKSSLLANCAIPCACHAKWHLNAQKRPEHVVLFTFWLGNVLRATTAYTFSTAQFLKLLRSWGVLCILTSKCASRHNGVHFFDGSIPKIAPKLRCFVHFDFDMCFGLQLRAFSTSHLPEVVRDSETESVNTFHFEMCFAPRPRALFRHLNFQKCSEDGVSCKFWLENALRGTTACNFSSLIWPDGSAPAALASLPFDPPEPQIIGKTEWIAAFLPFPAPSSSFLWLFLFSDLLSSSLLWLFPPLLFHLSILSEVWLPNFLRLLDEGMSNPVGSPLSCQVYCCCFLRVRCIPTSQVDKTVQQVWLLYPLPARSYKTMEYFPQKMWKNVNQKSKPPPKKKQIQKQKKQKNAKQCQKKGKKKKKQKQRQKEHIKSKTSNLNLHLVAKANTWPHANKYSNYQQQARRTWSINLFLLFKQW